MRMRSILAVGGLSLPLLVLLTGVADGQVPPPDADLAVTVVGSPSVARIGDTVTFVITAINNGPDGSSATQLTDTPPAELFGLSWSCASANGVTCPVLTGTGRVDLTTSYPVTGTLIITMSGTVTSMPPAGRIADQASVNTTGATDPNLTNNFGQDAVPVADLAVQKSATPTAIQLGTKITYTLTLTNAGLGDFTGAIVTDDLTGDLDDATYNNDAVATSPTVSFSSPLLTWSGTVPAQGTVIVTYSITVNDPASGDGVLTNGVVSSFGNCVAGSQDPACAIQVTTPPTTTTTVPTATTIESSTTTPAQTPPPPAASTTADVSGSTADSTVLPTTGGPLRLMTLSALLAVALGCGVFAAAVGRHRGQD